MDVPADLPLDTRLFLHVSQGLSRSSADAADDSSHRNYHNYDNDYYSALDALFPAELNSL